MLGNGSQGVGLDLYPEMVPFQKKHFVLCDLKPEPAYEKIAEAFGGYGERVEDPDKIIPALNRAVKAVKQENDRPF